MLKANKHNEDFYAKQKLCIRYSSNLHNLSQLNDELQYLMRLFEVSANQFEGTVLRSEDNCSHFNGLLYNLQIVEEYELPSEISDLKDAQNLFKLIRQKLTFMAHCLRQNKWNRSSINRDDVQIMYWKYWVGLQHHCLASFQEDTDDRIKSLRKASDHWNRLKSQLIPRLKFGDPNPNPAFIYK